MYLKRLCILISLVGAVISTKICVTESPCRCVKEGGQIIDLSSVASEGIPRFYEVKPEVKDNITFDGLYSYNPCLPFDAPDKVSHLKTGNVACKDAAACVRTPGGGDSQLPEEHTLGLQSSAEFGSTKDLGIHINYSVPNAQQSLTVKLVCNTSIEYHLSIDTAEQEDNTYVIMTFTSKCACDNVCPSTTPDEAYGLSTGSKLLIAFFTILLAYFIVGIVWNLCNGAQGIEMVPNLEFWNDVPKLVVEGVLFTCSCFGKKRSYGEV